MTLDYDTPFIDQLQWGTHQEQQIRYRAYGLVIQDLTGRSIVVEYSQLRALINAIESAHIENHQVGR